MAIGTLTALAVVCGATLASTSSAVAAGPRPLFQLPFPCGESWHLATYYGHDDYDIDMTANSGTTLGRPILASYAGTVSYAGWDDGGGWMVKINHGSGWETMYLHMVERPIVSTNQSVAGGQQLGKVGSTGDSSGPHLHYEQRADGQKIESYFDGVASGIRSDGSKNTGPIYVEGPVSQPVDVISRNGCPSERKVEQSEYADVDGDGRVDLIGISGPNHDLTAYRNQGWSASGDLVAGWDRKSLVTGFGDASMTTLADIDGDGRADLIAQSGVNNDITAYRNQGWGAANIFVGHDRKHLVSGFGPLQGLKFADIDGDGRADLINASGPSNAVYAYRNQGWGAAEVIVGWDRKSLVSSLGPIQDLKFADIDGDRRADLIGQSGPNNDLTAYRNQGWGAAEVIVGWDRKHVVSGFGPIWPLKFGDADGDKRADLITVTGSGNNHTAYRNQGWAAANLIVGHDRKGVVTGFQA